MKLYRYLNAGVFALATFLIVASLYFEYVSELSPCPLCIMQRLCVIMICFLAVVGFFVKKKSLCIVNLSLQAIFAITGMATAARQVWLQHLPADQVPACGPGLNFMLQYFPLKDVAHALFYGSGDCAEVHWTFLHLTMPEWTLAFFFVFLAAVIFQLWTAFKRFDI